jgi:eukaryotic-like serine/threonine-protein kinase
MGGDSKDPPPVVTLAYSERGRKPSAALDETVAAPKGGSTLSLPGSVRSTVLPRVERSQGIPRVVVEGRPRYEALRSLGSGGQAEVTLTQDHDINRTVALKRLLPERKDDASVLRFAEEIRTVGQLEHPNIVPIHDVGVDEAGNYFFVMKHVEGETLETIIENLRAGDEAYLRRYTPEYRLQICNEILRGVEHAHALGILHRDIKPANIMVGSLGEAVIMDWGLAKRVADGGEAVAPAKSATTGEAPPKSAGSERARLFETQSGALMGTPAYMAPEQAAGRLDAVDARSDVYSLAVTFHEFLSLRHPRRHCATVAEMIASVMHEPVKKLQVIGDFTHAGAPAALAHFVRHGLDADPSKRYPSVTAMRARLDAVRDGKAPVECHVTFTQRVLSAAARGANRHPYVLGLVLAGGAAGIVGAGVALVRALAH